MNDLPLDAFRARVQAETYSQHVTAHAQPNNSVMRCAGYRPGVAATFDEQPESPRSEPSQRRSLESTGQLQHNGIEMKRVLELQGSNDDVARGE